MSVCTQPRVATLLLAFDVKPAPTPSRFFVTAESKRLREDAIREQRTAGRVWKLPPPTHPCFSEVVENVGLICLRVRKSAKSWEGGIENKGVSGWSNADFWRVLEVAVNEGVKGILWRVGEWCEAGMRTGSVAVTTNTIIAKAEQIVKNYY